MTAKTVTGKALEHAVTLFTNEIAFEICVKFVNNLDAERKPGEYFIIAEAASILMERAETPEQEELGDEIFAKYPVIFDYDADGNYIGSVAHENGYTN